MDSRCRVASLRRARSLHPRPSCRGAARDDPRLQHAGVDGHVFHRFLDALAHRAHAVAGLEAAVPQQADEALDLRARHVAVGQQDQDVDVGVREQQAASIAAHRHQRDGRVVDGFGPQGLQQLVHVGRVGREHARGFGPAQVTRAQRVAPLLQPGADGGRLRRRLAEGSRARRREGRGIGQGRGATRESRRALRRKPAAGAQPWRL